MRALFITNVVLALPLPASIVSNITAVTGAFRLKNPNPGDCHWERATLFFGWSAAMTLTASSSADIAFSRAWAEGNSYSCHGLYVLVHPRPPKSSHLRRVTLHPQPKQI